MVLDYRKNELEEQMLMNLHQKSWTDGLKTVKYEEQSATNEKTVKVGAQSFGAIDLTVKQPLPNDFVFDCAFYRIPRMAFLDVIT
jgi:26S proteasome regulatory subunit N11